MTTLLKRCLNQLNYKYNTEPKFVHPNIEKPLGLIDLDYGNQNLVSHQKKLDGRVVILDRYAIENFFFDPILFFYNHMISITSILDNFPDSDFKKLCLEILNLKDLEDKILQNSNVFD